MNAIMWNATFVRLLPVCICLGVYFLYEHNVATQSNLPYSTSSKVCLRHLKYLKHPILYYTNGESSFRIELLSCGDINPNPGPSLDFRHDNYCNKESFIRYSISELYHLRPLCNSNSVLTQTRKLIKDLGISFKHTRHRGKRGGIRKQRHRSFPISIPVRIRPRLPPRRCREESLPACLIKVDVIPQSCSSPKKYDTPVVLLSNCRSLRNKYEDLVVVADVNKVDAIAVTETWFNHDIPLEMFTVPGFSLFSKPREDRSGGGVALYAKHYLQASILDVPVPDGVEALWIHMRPPRLPRIVASLIVCVIYILREPLMHTFILIIYLLQLTACLLDTLKLASQF